MNPLDSGPIDLIERRKRTMETMAEAGFFPAPEGWQTALSRGVPVSCKREGPMFDRRLRRPISYGLTYYFKFHDTGIQISWIVQNIHNEIKFLYPPIGPVKERKVREYWRDPDRWIARYALGKLR